jgi:hypothetical protein
MCCSLRGTYCDRKSFSVNVLSKMKRLRRKFVGKYRVFFVAFEGNWAAFSFYEVEANLEWIHSLPPSAMCCVQLG